MISTVCLDLQESLIDLHRDCFLKRNPISTGNYAEILQCLIPCCYRVGLLETGLQYHWNNGKRY